MYMSYKKKNTELIQVILCFFASLFLLEPTCLPYVTSIEKFYNVISIAVCAAILLLYLWYNKISRIILLISIYYFYQIAMTWYNSGNLKGILLLSIKFIAICMFIEIGLNLKNKFIVINSLMTVLEIYIYINLLTILIYPNGMYVTVSTDNANNWFLGYKNQMINFILPAIGLCLFNYYCNDKFAYKKLRTGCILVCGCLTTILMWSGASLVLLAILIVYVLLAKKLPTKIFNFRNFLIVNIILTVSIVLFRIQNIFSFLIVDILHKDITLTGRIYIWDKVLKYIYERPLVGYGVESYSYRCIKMRSIAPLTYYDYYGALHGHCRFLEVMYRGGIILLIIYLLILIYSCRELMRHKNSMQAKIISITIFAYLTGMITEWYDYSPMFFALLVLGYNIQRFLNESSKSKEVTERVS